MLFRSITFIENSEYNAAPEGLKIMLLTLDEAPAENTTYKYDGGMLLWSEKYEAFVMMVDVDLTAEAALAKITAEADTEGNISIDYSGDLVAPGGVNAYDAQVVFELYNGTHMDGFGRYTELQRFMADVNGDGKINMADVYMVQLIVLAVGG